MFRARERRPKTQLTRQAAPPRTVDPHRTRQCHIARRQDGRWIAEPISEDRRPDRTGNRWRALFLQWQPRLESLLTRRETVSERFSNSEDTATPAVKSKESIQVVQSTLMTAAAAITWRKLMPICAERFQGKARQEILALKISTTVRFATAGSEVEQC